MFKIEEITRNNKKIALVRIENPDLENEAREFLVNHVETVLGKTVIAISKSSDFDDNFNEFNIELSVLI